jgi:hypothetical protein
MGGDIKGGGMQIYETNTQANPSLQYGEGLVVPNPSAHMELDNLINTGTLGKIKSYDRVNSFLIFRESSFTTDQMLPNTSPITCSLEDSKNL